MAEGEREMSNCAANAGKNGIAPYIIPNEVISKLFLEYLEKLRLEQYDEGFYIVHMYPLKITRKRS